MSGKQALFLRTGVCAVLALCLAIPMPVLFSQPVHAKAGLSASQHIVSHQHHSHMFLPGRSAANADPPASVAPVPLPGGDTISPVGLIHIFFPGPTSIGDDGLDIEPGTITNFRGFSAVAMQAGTATDSMENNFIVATDFRVMQGEYVSADGKHHRGTFVMI